MGPQPDGAGGGGWFDLPELGGGLGGGQGAVVFEEEVVAAVTVHEGGAKVAKRACR